jgi:TIR domain
MPPRKPTIFISYSHKDEPDPLLCPGEFRWLSYVKSHLAPAAEHGLIELWDDSRIDGGDAWRKDINDALERCAICILLVSRYSLSSRFILDVEMKRMLERHHENGVHLYPIVITSTDLGCAPWLRRFNIRPRDGVALELYEPGPRNRIMAELAGEIRGKVESATESGPSDQPCDFQLCEREQYNPVGHCAELRSGTGDKSTYHRLRLLPELRCGTETIKINDVLCSFGVRQLDLRLKLSGCKVAPGIRLGDRHHPFVCAKGLNTWTITGPRKNNVLLGLVVGADVLCDIDALHREMYNIIIEVWCLQFHVRYFFELPDRRKMCPAKEKVLGVFINKCLGVQDGFIRLCRSDFDVLGVRHAP